MKKLLGIALVTVLSLSLVACGGNDAASSPTPAPVTNEIPPIPAGYEDARIINLDFTPQTIVPNSITLKAGEKVVFEIVNTDPDGEHNFLSKEIGLPEILVDGGQTVRSGWEVPNKPGTYEPLCTIHPWIKMTFVVEE
ncbi:hypothetical protein BHU72_05485 [Desulfuribacillus stibiiarsenatis]|uniref:EfeO-type cupredoxin-like domain-containing protein n=1 Tax=Desulfuribacillus stibiiarsenatis TaxID=1390249 RepID=A0A1E5L4X4_9FIRM|nr:cupredoxin domain-containing protein [Desulfuribacillus stibiiarsenatis]OEH85063.1 hypothetical protein BHU72_05485 [Desulfuribacillus stibiiarsenatis]